MLKHSREGNNPLGQVPIPRQPALNQVAQPATLQDPGAPEEEEGHPDDINLGDSRVKKDRRGRLRERLLDHLAKNKGTYGRCNVSLAYKFACSFSD